MSGAAARIKKPPQTAVRGAAAVAQDIDFMPADKPARRITTFVRLCAVMTLVAIIGVAAAWMSLSASKGSLIVALATDAKGVVVPIVPLSESFASDQQVLAFAATCVHHAFSHDYLRFGETLLQGQACIKSGGFLAQPGDTDAADRYASNMQPFFKIMRDKSMNMAVSPVLDGVCPAQPTSFPLRPVLVDRGLQSNGTFAWQLAVLVCFSFEGHDQRIVPVAYRIDLTVERASLEESSDGLQVSSFFIKPAV